MIGKRAKKVRVHFHTSDPSLEGFLVSRRHGEYELALPKLLLAADTEPAPLDDARSVLVPKTDVWFIENLR